MKKYNTEAIVLKNINLKDADKVYTLLCRDVGKIGAIARGVRKISSRRAGNLDTLNLITVSITESDKGFKSIDEVKVINSFKQLKTNLPKIHAAYYLAELIHKSLEEHTEAVEVFMLFRQVLGSLDGTSYPIEVVSFYFEICFLRILGYRPRISDIYYDIDNLTLEGVKKADPMIKSIIYEHLASRFKSLELKV